MTPQPVVDKNRHEAVMNSLTSAMQSVNNAVLHLVVIEPFVGHLEEIARLEDIFAKLRGKYQQQAGGQS